MLRSAHTLLAPIVVLGISIAIMQYVATELDLYWVLGWFDILMHTLGGIWVTFLSFWFISHFYFFRSEMRSTFFLASVLVLLTVIIGVTWEIFELKTGLTSVHQYYYWKDTVLDLVMDVVGACVAGFFLTKKSVAQVSVSKSEFV